MRIDAIDDSNATAAKKEWICIEFPKLIRKKHSRLLMRSVDFFFFVYESRNFWAYADFADFKFRNVGGKKKSKWEAVPETADPFPSKDSLSSAVVLSARGNLHTFNDERVQKNKSKCKHKQVPPLYTIVLYILCIRY